MNILIQVDDKKLKNKRRKKEKKEKSKKEKVNIQMQVDEKNYYGKPYMK